MSGRRTGAQCARGKPATDDEGLFIARDISVIILAGRASTSGRARGLRPGFFRRAGTRRFFSVAKARPERGAIVAQRSATPRDFVIYIIHNSWKRAKGESTPWPLPRRRRLRRLVLVRCTRRDRYRGPAVAAAAAARAFVRDIDKRVSTAGDGTKVRSPTAPRAPVLGPIRETAWRRFSKYFP